MEIDPSQDAAHTLAAALRRRSPWRAARAVHVEPAGRPEEAAAFFRIRIEGAHSPEHLFAKRVDRSERAAHAFVAHRLGGVVPRWIGVIGPWLLMEDLASRGMCPLGATLGPAAYPAFQQALGMLARVHATSCAHTVMLRRRGVRANPSASAATGAVLRALPASLDLAVGLLGVPLERVQLDALSAIVRGLETRPIAARDPTPACLVHGDLQPGNVFVGARRAAFEVCITDWGEAAVEKPQWDLATCGEQEVAFYLERAQEESVVLGTDFWTELRGVVIVRMALVIASCVGAIFQRPPAVAAALMELIPALAARLLEAAETSDFRGGVPLWRRVAAKSARPNFRLS